MKIFSAYIISGLFLFFLLSLTIVTARQTSKKSTKSKKGAGKVILLDNYFNSEYKKDATGATVPFHYLWNETQSGGFSLWGEIFNELGAETATLRKTPTAENLSKASVYIIVDPDNPKETAKPNYMDEASAKNIYSWVKAGGVLVMMMNDSVNTEFDYFNILPEKFGIHFNKNYRNAVPNDVFEMGMFTVPAGHQIFKTAQTMFMKEICTISIKSPAKAMFSDKGDVIMAVAKIGKGTVFAVGDPWLYNEYTDGKRLPAKYENFKAMQDLSKWLLKRSKK